MPDVSAPSFGLTLFMNLTVVLTFLFHQFQLPIETAYSLKWHNVFDMLNRKMLTLGGRDLCKDEKDHLGSRLMLGESVCRQM